MFIHKSIKVRKKRWTPIVILKILSRRKRMRSFWSSWWRIEIYASYLEKCSTFGMVIITFKLGGHTLIWTIPMNWSGMWRFIPLFKYHKWPDWVAHSYDRHKQVRFHFHFSFLFPHMSNCFLLVINGVYGECVSMRVNMWTWILEERG
jgi:hypothetical protein